LVRRFAILLLASLTLASAASADAPAAGPLAQAHHAQALAAALLDAPPAQGIAIAAREAGLDAPALPVAQLSVGDALVALHARGEGSLAPGEAAAVRARAATLPADLQAPVARLLSGEVAAIAVRDQAFASLSPAEQSFLAAKAPLAGVSPKAPTSSNEAIRFVDGGLSSADRARVQELAARVDLAKLAQAEEALAQAAADALPGLRAAALATPPAASSCAFVFADAPYLAIDGTEDCTWTADWWVAIDLGGDDTYLNNAGAAVGLAIPAAALVDVAGNDQYLAIKTGTTTSQTAISQGSGDAGVGFLLDAGGTNTYAAAADVSPPPLTDPAPTATVVAQGAGVVGAGALVDLGTSTFTARADTLGGAAAATAQGAAVDGVGFLAGGGSLGASASSNLLLVQETPNSLTYAFGNAGTVAQGGASVGAAALASGTGSDALTAASQGAQATTIAQGAGDLGAGLLADAGGANVLTASASGAPVLAPVITVVCPANTICSQSLTVDVNMGSSTTLAQGAGLTGAGIAAVGGALHASATVAPVASATIVFGGGGGSGGVFDAEATVVGGSASLEAHGDGELGTGVLVGGASDDLYDASAVSQATALASSSGGSTNVAGATSTAGDSVAHVQGNAATGVGVLLDPAGNDRYSVKQASSALALANGAPGSSTPGQLRFAGRATTTGDGASGLIDLGGTDTYSPTAHGNPGADGTCWTNSPPGVTSEDLNVALGIDNDGTSLVGSPSCSFPLPPN
jgi:hypothetical protein